MHNRPAPRAQPARKQEKLNESPTVTQPRRFPDRWSDSGGPRSPYREGCVRGPAARGRPFTLPEGAGTGPVGLLSDPRQTPHRGAGGWQSKDPCEAP